MFRFLSIALLCLSLTCCAALRKTPTPEPDYHHTIKYSGETLWMIAHWYTGDGKNWKTLQKHNTNLRHNRLRIGDTIRIPRTLLKRSKPLPKPKVTTQKKPTPASSTSQTGETKDVEDIWITPPEPGVSLEAARLPQEKAEPVATPTPIAPPTKQEVKQPKQPSTSTRDSLWDEIVSKP